MVYPRYCQMYPSLEAVRDSLERSYFVRQPEIEARALSLYENDKTAALQYLNDYSNRQAASMLECWKRLATYLIVKYNDMTIRPEENGVFKRTETGLGARVARPGFPKSFARELIRQTGEKYAMP